MNCSKERNYPGLKFNILNPFNCITLFKNDQMKKLYINTGGINSIFNDLKDSLNGVLTLENNQYNIQVNSKNANGFVSGISLSRQISYLQFDIVFNDDILLSVESNAYSPILFVNCSQGILSHGFGINGDRKKIKPNHTGIIRNTSNINNVFYFEGYKRVQFSVVSCHTSNVENIGLFSDLNKVFFNASGHYFNVGPKNFKITKKINELNTIPQKGIVKNLLRSRILESILEIELDKHTYGYAKDIKPIITLANKQITELKRVSNLSLLEVFSGAGQVSRNYFSRVFKEKYHLAFSKIYNQKLVS